jgi:hypothetical protein
MIGGEKLALHQTLSDEWLMCGEYSRSLAATMISLDPLAMALANSKP